MLPQIMLRKGGSFNARETKENIGKILKSLFMLTALLQVLCNRDIKAHQIQLLVSGSSMNLATVYFENVNFAYHWYGPFHITLTPFMAF